MINICLLAAHIWLSGSLEFKKVEHDFGKIKGNRVLSTMFLAENHSNDTIRIFNVSSSCGCTVASYPKIVLPKTVAKFTVNFNTAGIKGLTERKMIVITNAKHQYYTITVKAEVL
jgi:hypothetical protein